MAESGGARRSGSRQRSPHSELLPCTIQLHVKWDRKAHGNFIELDNFMRVVFLHSAADFALDNLVVGDIVCAVDGKQFENPFECEDVFHSCQQACLVCIRRRRFVSPVPPGRAKAIALKRRPQFAYLMLTVGRGKKTMGYGLGAIVVVKGERYYVCQTVKGGLSEGILYPGDAILDLDGKPIPANSEFLKQFSEALSRSGRLSVVVERPAREELAASIVADVLNGKSFRERPMAEDAVEIGLKAAHDFLRQRSSVPPKSILRAAPVDDQEKTPLRYNQNIHVETEIGTDVTDRSRLKPVTKDEDPEKSGRRNRSSLFEDFYDVL